MAWTIEDSEKLYQIQGWGQPYFSIDVTGRILVSPQGDGGGSLDLYELVHSLRRRNLDLPLLIRFPDILADRIARLNTCFARAIDRYHYPNVYRGVYPIKCNQHRHLVEALVEFGKPYQFGLEVGSKPELAIALATLEPAPNSQNDACATLLICNGYKDREYMEMALLARRLGHRAILAIEQIEELEIAIAASQSLGIQPILGVRAKLSTKGSGRWGDSTGDRAKFGLSVPQILAVVTRLREMEMLPCLQLLHFHIGSQISEIGVIKDAIREASQIYGELVKLGANMQYLDVGGGLAVDYSGSKTNSGASKNYNIQNYANDIVAEVKDVCEERKIPAPILVSESGRAIAAHQSILIFDILGINQAIGDEISGIQNLQTAQNAEHQILRNIGETHLNISADNYQESYHDAIQFKNDAISLFNFGYLSLQERAKAEHLYWQCCQKIFKITRDRDDVPDDLADLEKNMASIYYANLSIFQSAPDAWAIEQLFPILPIHRLDEEPTERGFFADLTCDSDGKLKRFIDRHDGKEVLELHPLKTDREKNAIEPYYLGMFLVGAYQEIMGNLHNLFGDTNVVHIKMTPKGYQVEHLVKGDTLTDVLGYAQYNAENLIEKIRFRSEQAIQEDRITLEESQELLKKYKSSLDRYTYLNANILND